MIGLDTNIIIRYLTQDDPKQAAIASQFIESELTEKHRGFITLNSLVEIVWVLESCYDQKKAELVAVMESLLTLKQIIIEKTDVVHLALQRYQAGNADFSDALIAVVCEDAGCQRVVTFDKQGTTIGMEKI